MTGEQRACGNDAAPFVLGALEPDDARAFADHMASCAVCRDEVAALTPVIDALPSSAPRYEVSGALRRRVMQQVRAEPRASTARPHRKRSWSLRSAPAPRRRAIAAALGLALALVAIATAVLGSGSRSRVIQASVGRAQLRIAGSHGELIVDRLEPAPPGRVYELWLQRGTRAPAPSTLFAVTSRDTADVGVPGQLAGITRLLVTVEPAGGSRVPTTRPVIVARLT